MRSCCLQNHFHISLPLPCIMSLSLLGQYGSGSESEISDSDDEQFVEHTCSSSASGTVVATDLARDWRSAQHVLQEVEASSHSSGGAKKTVHADAEGDDCGDLLDHKDSKSDSDSDSDAADSGGSPAAEGSPAALLPLPDLDSILKGPTKGQSLPGSVFSNPYKAAEEAKLAVLTRHVDFDRPHPQRVLDNQAGRPQGGYAYHPHGMREVETKPVRPGDEFFDDSDSSVARATTKRKHRGGVGNSLIPSKKVMKHHHRMQAKDRPWTM